MNTTDGPAGEPLHTVETRLRSYAEQAPQWPLAQDLRRLLREYDRRGVELDSRAAVHATTTTTTRTEET